MTERRRFIATAGGAVAAVAAAAIVDAPNVIAQPNVQRRMSTAWPSALDNLQGAARRLAQVVEETSGGRFRIEVFAGGQLMPDFACFDGASQGTIEAFMGAPSYWAQKEPAIEWSGSGEKPPAPSTSCRAKARRSLRRWPDGSGTRLTGWADESDFVVSVQARVRFASICRVWGGRGAATASVAAF